MLLRLYREVRRARTGGSLGDVATHAGRCSAIMRHFITEHQRRSSNRVESSRVEERHSEQHRRTSGRVQTPVEPVEPVGAFLPQKPKRRDAAWKYQPPLQVSGLGSPQLLPSTRPHFALGAAPPACAQKNTRHHDFGDLFFSLNKTGSHSNVEDFNSIFNSIQSPSFWGNWQIEIALKLKLKLKFESD